MRDKHSDRRFHSRHSKLTTCWMHVTRDNFSHNWTGCFSLSLNHKLMKFFLSFFFSLSLRFIWSCTLVPSVIVCVACNWHESPACWGCEKKERRSAVHTLPVFRDERREGERWECREQNNYYITWTRQVINKSKSIYTFKRVTHLLIKEEVIATSAVVHCTRVDVCACFLSIVADHLIVDCSTDATRAVGDAVASASPVIHHLSDNESPLREK